RLLGGVDRLARRVRRGIGRVRGGILGRLCRLLGVGRRLVGRRLGRRGGPFGRFLRRLVGLLGSRLGVLHRLLGRRLLLAAAGQERERDAQRDRDSPHAVPPWCRSPIGAPASPRSTLAGPRPGPSAACQLRFSRSRISVSSLTSAGGSGADGGAAGFLSRLTALTSRKTQKATIRKSMTFWMKTP